MQAAVISLICFLFCVESIIAQTNNFFGGSCTSQQENANQLKYWEYRKRFLRDFIKIGIGGTSLADNDQSASPHASVWGRSIPMARINASEGVDDDGNDNTPFDDDYQIDAGDNPMLTWG